MVAVSLVGEHGELCNMWAPGLLGMGLRAPGSGGSRACGLEGSRARGLQGVGAERSRARGLQGSRVWGL